MRAGEGTNPVYEAAHTKQHRAARVRWLVTIGTALAALALLGATVGWRSSVATGDSDVEDLARSWTNQPGSKNQDAEQDAAPATAPVPAAVGLAPFVAMTEDNAWLFLRDKQHEQWRDEVQDAWTVSKQWARSTEASPQTLDALQDQKTCLTYQVSQPRLAMLRPALTDES